MHKQFYLFGVGVFAAGAAAFVYAAPKMDTIRSAFGQLAIAFGGQQVAGQAQVWQLLYYGGIVGMVSGGTLLVAGLLQQVTRGGSSSDAATGGQLPSPKVIGGTYAATPTLPGQNVGSTLPYGGQRTEAATAPPVIATHKAKSVPASPNPSARASFSLRFPSGASLALAEGARLNAGDTFHQDATPDTVVAEVSSHPGDPSVLGLKNLTLQVWSATLANGEQRQVEPGRSIRLATGTRIDFGPITAEVRG
jgi:hypothetical protein